MNPMNPMNPMILSMNSMSSWEFMDSMHPWHPQHGYPPVLGWLVLGWANPLPPGPPNLGVRVAHVGFFGGGEWEGAISE